MAIMAHSIWLECCSIVINLDKQGARMTAATDDEGLRINIELRQVRAEAERGGRLPEHAAMVSELVADVRSLLDTRVHTSNPRVSVVPLVRTEPSSKAEPQIIDTIMISLAPLGVAGVTALVLKIVDAIRAKMPNTYEADLPGVGRFKISGPSVKPEDLIKFKDAVLQMHQQPTALLYSARGNPLRIGPVEKGRQ